MNVWYYFFLTVVIELPFIVYWLWPNWKDSFVIGLLLNLTTWPLLVTFYECTAVPIIVLELGVVLVEALGFRLFFKKSWFACGIVSLFVNALSYGIGLYLQ